MDGEPMLHPAKEGRLQNAHFKIVGENKHTAVKLCHWTKASIKTGEESHCYKQKFYGIESHRCMQMTPALPFCNLCCQFCWRDVTQRNAKWKGNFDHAHDVVKNSFDAHKNLLAGLGGVPHSHKHLKEANDPKHVAISLDGEPTLYPQLGEMIKHFHEHGLTTFLVTNGTNPEAIRQLVAEDALPTQLYVSVYGYDEASFKKTSNPLERDAWQKLNETLELLPTLNIRKVCRLTLLKEHNLEHPEKWAELLQKASPDFIECKAAMAVGFAKSQNRMKYEDMSSMEEIREFSRQLSQALGYRYEDDKEDSRVVLLMNPMSPVPRFIQQKLEIVSLIK